MSSQNQFVQPKVNLLLHIMLVPQEKDVISWVIHADGSSHEKQESCRCSCRQIDSRMHHKAGC